MAKVTENKHISVIDLPNIVFDILSPSENTPSMICVDREIKEETDLSKMAEFMHQSPPTAMDKYYSATQLKISGRYFL